MEQITKTHELRMSPEGVTFMDGAANLGVRDLGLCLTVDGCDAVVRYAPAEALADGGLVAEGDAGHGLTVATTVTPVPGLAAVVIRHCVRNTGSAPVCFAAASGQYAPTAAVLSGSGSWLGWDLRFCHTDHVRTERYPHCQMEYPYLRMLPVEPVTLGRGEDQAFPALYLANQHAQRGLVFAAASQDLHFIAFTLQKNAFVNEGVFARFAISHDPGQVDGFTVAPGGEVALDGLFIQLTGAPAVDEVYNDYIDYLAARFPFRGAATPLRREAFHCTWNYGIFANQTEASLLPTARAIAEHVPQIKWFLMDAGYLEGDISTTFLDRFYPDPEGLVTAEKWPTGIRGFSDEIRRLGLRPGLWWSPTVQLDSSLYADHPDWFLRTADGTPYRIGEKNGFLDYTHPEALAFLDRTLAHILGAWGMDACKMDFWSQNFEDRRARLQDPTMTSVQARTRFFETIRKHLPADGIFMTCVATGMGNPFIGQWADTYRNTIDIGVGKWDEQVRNCIWALPTLGFEGRKTFLLNNDSAGIMVEYPDHENVFRLTWSYMHMGMIETGGRMETWPARWLAAMRKLTDRCDRGYQVHCPDDRAFTGVPLPEALYVDFPADSPTGQAGVRQSVALFNWTDEPRIVSVRRARLGHDGPVDVENFWTGARSTWDDEFVTARLDGRSAVLFDVLR
jgi:hypothetical protein